MPACYFSLLFQLAITACYYSLLLQKGIGGKFREIFLKKKFPRNFRMCALTMAHQRICTGIGLAVEREPVRYTLILLLEKAGRKLSDQKSHMIVHMLFCAYWNQKFRNHTRYLVRLHPLHIWKFFATFFEKKNPRNFFNSVVSVAGGSARIRMHKLHILKARGGKADINF
jgi:hypothetical protein